jgi:carbamoyltransferase
MFYTKTNIPGLINTSFNINGKPIVETINDAISVLLQSKIDYIIFNYEFKIEKQ